GGYSQDSDSVFYQGKKIHGIYGSSFQVLGGTYRQNYETVYYEGKIVEGASPASFQTLGGGYVTEVADTTQRLE
ncbi:MAG TPA: hypothetical protein PLG79_12030, partial [Spirochaetales bacterium]|nr:hypothetical protein [Spirochaetales bacterium]